MRFGKMIWWRKNRKETNHGFPDELFVNFDEIGNELEFQAELKHVFDFESRDELHVAVFKFERVMLVTKSANVVEDDVTEEFKPKEEKE